MIFGTGIDHIEVERVRKKLTEDPEFKMGLFTEHEIAYCESKARSSQHFAARFCAKEAFFKAIGTGWRNGFSHRDIQVVNDALGKPEIELSGVTADWAETKGLGRIHVSLSHLKETASAIVTIELK